jgi:hypothetical protein
MPQAPAVGPAPGRAPNGPRRLLDHLPDGPLRGIAAHLQDPLVMVRDINALASLSRTLRQALITVPQGDDVLREFHLLNHPTRAINRCLNELAALDPTQPVPNFVGCGAILGMLTPAVRSKLVQGAIGKGDLVLRGKAIAELAVGMADLSLEDRTRLVAATCRIPDGPGMDWDRARGTAVALAGLLEGQDNLDPDQCASLITVASNLVVAGEGGFNAAVIAALGKAIRHLPADQREILVDRAINQPIEQDRSMALASLGAAMAAERSMNAGGRIVEAALLLGDEDARAFAVGHLAVGMGSMELGLRRRFVTVALGFTNELLNVEVACRLGAASEYLSHNERANLVNRATAPETNPFHGAAANDHHQLSMSFRVCGLAAGMAHLTAPQCDALASTALNLSDVDDRADAIGALGLGLQHLSETRREELVVAALAFDNHQHCRMLSVITALGAGARHLDDDQRNRLIGAVSLITTSHSNTAIAKLGALSAIAASARAAI